MAQIGYRDDFGVGKDGARSKTAQDIVNSFEKNMQTFLGNSNYIIDNSEFTGAFLQVIAIELSDAQNMALISIMAQSIDWAVGAILDALVQGEGEGRNEATHATCDSLFIIGDDGFLLPEGTRFVADNGNIYTLDDKRIINKQGVTVKCTSVSTGVGSGCGIGEINQLETPNSSVDSISNKAIVVDGNPSESDDDLRERFVASIAIEGGSSMNGLREELLALDDVNEAYVYANNTGNTINVGGRDLEKGEIYCVVMGGKDEDIAKTILNTKSATAITIGDVMIQETTDSGQDIEIRFQKGKVKTLNVEITSSSHQDLADTTKDLIESKFASYMNFLKIAKKIDYDVIKAIIESNYEIDNDLLTIKISTTDDQGVESALVETDIAGEFSTKFKYIKGNTKFNNLGDA